MQKNEPKFLSCKEDDEQHKKNNKKDPKRYISVPSDNKGGDSLQPKSLNTSLSSIAGSQSEAPEESPPDLMYYFCATFIILCILLFAIGFLSNLWFKRPVPEQMIIKSIVDQKKYDYFKLKNGLKVMVVKPLFKTKRAAIAYNVGVGSSSDPIEHSGLFHLMEHMLFTGSSKFPKNGFLDKVLQKYGGSSNAVTKAFSTTFYSKFNSKGLKEVSEVIADAIKSPLFLEKNIE